MISPNSIIRQFPRLRTGILALSLFAVACGTHDLAGTATETTNGYALASNGSPLTGANVRLIDAHNWLDRTGRGLSAVVESTTTDAAGRFTLHSRPDNGRNLQVDAEHEGMVLAGIESRMGFPADTIFCFAKPYATVQGTVDPSAASVKDVFIGGTACRIAVGMSGDFSETNVPEGIFPLVTKATGANGVALAGVFDFTSGNSLATGALSADTALIPVEDFTFGWGRTNLGRVLGDGYWFTYCDTAAPYNGGSSIVTEIVSGADAWSGNSLHATLLLGPGFDLPFVGFGFHLGDPETLYNCTKLSKIAFMSKGKGSIRVALKNGLSQDAGMVFALPPVWTRVEIPLDSLKSTDAASALDRTKVDRVEFSLLGQFGTIGDTVSFYIDNIEFEGMNLQEIVQ
jgi:hypothetical protein